MECALRRARSCAWTPGELIRCSANRQTDVLMLRVLCSEALRILFRYTDACTDAGTSCVFLPMQALILSVLCFGVPMHVPMRAYRGDPATRGIDLVLTGEREGQGQGQGQGQGGGDGGR
eukprot:1845171-Rhodomonas_salina.4